MASSDSISEIIKPCGECLFLNTIMDGSCPISSGLPCFFFSEACRLRKKYWSAGNDEILAHMDLVVTKGINKSPPRPDNPEAYLRTISVNLEKKIVEEDVKRKAVFEASHDEGPLADYAAAVKERGFEGDSVELRDTVAFFLSKLPEEKRSGHVKSTRDFLVLYALHGNKPSELVKKYPDLTVTEIKHHQRVVRETREELKDMLGDF